MAVLDLLVRPRRTMTETTPARTAIIDIGSNSVRLVVYQGPARLPAVLFNEKVMAGLGRSLSATGAIDADAMALAAAALARFAWLAREMGATETRTVATAAVRDASNGGELIATAGEVGLQVELLSGEEEASASGYGVLSAFPEADGIVGDLGGGSLELVRVVAGTVTDRVSFPLGVLRLPAIAAKGRGALEKRIAEQLAQTGWAGRGKGLPLYMVGGSWRALARLDMFLTRYPLPVIHGYMLGADGCARVLRATEEGDRARLKLVPDLSSARLPTLPHATRLLQHLIKHLGSTVAIASAYGLREGLLHQRLPAATRQLDPLIEQARDEGARFGRFPEHGDLLDRWLQPLFADEPRELARLRHAACLLADTGWRANPEFRAERGVEIGLHGAWVAIDAAGRALVAQALHTSLGGGVTSPEPLPTLASPADLACAIRWGLAIRLGQRLSGGVAAPLARTTLGLDGKRLVLGISAADRALYGDAVQRRHRALAQALGAEAALG